jgi:uncharacterized membrane protein YphA (DoxX/SURF4 family)
MSATRGFQGARVAPVLLLLCRLIVGMVFIVASWNKMLDPAGFAKLVHAYKLLPLPLVNPFAVVLPWIEFVAGVLLILGAFPRSAATVSALLTIMFIVAISLTMIRGLSIDCGCFSLESGSEVGWSLLLRDIVLLAITIPLILSPRMPLVLVPDQRSSSAGGPAADQSWNKRTNS